MCRDSLDMGIVPDTSQLSRGKSMPAKIIYERFVWFHRAVKADQFPNATALARHFELSPKTAQRDIEFMRDRLQAPLVYHAGRRGYAYDDSAWELPGIWLKEEELVSLLIAYRLASAIPGSAMKESLKSFLDATLHRLSLEGFLSIDDLSDKVSIKNIEYSKANEYTFTMALDALFRSKPLIIKYYSPHNNETTTRDVLPLHLLNYGGTWHLVAHCNLKQDMRDFVLSRIVAIAPSASAIESPLTSAEVKDYLRQHFGIMTGGETIEVCLRFSSAASPWLAEQIWHPDQQMRWEDDSTLCLTFPVADFREIKREILRHGADVEVAAPPRLREEVHQEIQKMARLYQK